MIATKRSESFKSSNISKWTRNEDIFAYDYLIMPINHSLHWLLAIICYPRLVPTTEDSSIGKPCLLLFDSMTNYSRNGQITKHIRA